MKDIMYQIKEIELDSAILFIKCKVIIKEGWIHVNYNSNEGLRTSPLFKIVVSAQARYQYEERSEYKFNLKVTHYDQNVSVYNKNAVEGYFEEMMEDLMVKKNNCNNE